MDSPHARPPRVRFGTFELDLGTGDLRRGRVPVHLQAQPTAVLLLLVENAGRLVGREEIGRLLWGDRWEELDPGINTCISQIRSALGDNAASPVFVSTIPRRGYRFIAPLEPLPDDTAQPQPVDAVAGTGRLGRSVPRWPVAAAATLALGAFAVLAAVSRAGPPEPADPRIMLAVLPFETMDADSGLSYVGAGMAEELITLLANVEPDRFGVIARTSSVAAWRSGQSVARIGAMLDVDYVVEGAIRSGGDGLRITAQLIRVDDESHVWADSWDRGLVDVLDVQRDIARRVTGALALTLAPEAPPFDATPPGTASSPARTLTLEARYLMDRGDTPRALILLDSAIAADSTHAPAWTAAAQAHAASGNAALARNAASRAVAFDDGQVEAHLLLGAYLWQTDWNRDAAETEYRRALALAPGRADVHHARALFLAATGRTAEAVDAVETAMRLDPVSTLVIGDAALVHYLARDFERADAYARRVLALDDDNLAALTQLVNIAAERDRAMETLEWGIALGRAVRGDSTTPSQTVTDTTAAWLSFWQSWIDWFAENTTGPTRAYQTAIGFARLGQPDSAIARLEAGFALRRGGLAFLGSDPVFDAIRDDPRVHAIVRGIGLESERPTGK